MVYGVLDSSGSFLSVSRRAAEATTRDPSQAVVTVIFAITSVEALVNGVLERAARSNSVEDPAIARLVNLVRALRANESRMPLVAKIGLIRSALVDEAPDWQAAPLDDFRLLIQVRNALIHARPERVGFTSAEHRLDRVARRLAERRVVTLEPGVIHSLMSVIRTQAVADWAYLTAEQTFRYLAATMPGVYLPNTILMRLPGWRPPSDGDIHEASESMNTGSPRDSARATTPTSAAVSNPTNRGGSHE